MLKKDAHCNARLGVWETPHGKVKTPVFMPVATQAALRGLPGWLAKDLGSQVLLANSYHLHLSPGEEVVTALGGLHTFMQWDQPIITDSGGYQVFSLPGREVSEEGVRFRYEKNGQRVHLSPESAMALQFNLGADIVMALDVCHPHTASFGEAKASMERTLRWALRCQAAHQKLLQRQNPASLRQQALFGIVQGGVHGDLRKECAQQIAALDLPGIAVGGLSVGEGLEEMIRVLTQTVPHLPVDRPRYLMGVGFPEDVLAWVEAGMDMSDCVVPTRHARSGVLFTRVGRLRITQRRYRKDRLVPDTSCRCPVCERYSRAYIHHLFQVGETLGAMLAAVHNVHFYLQMMQDVQKAIAEDRFLDFKRDFLTLYLRHQRKDHHVG